MENYDFNSLANKLEQVMLSAAEELIEVEAMRNITVSDEAFERLMTLSEKAGLITKPTVHRDDKGSVSKAMTSTHCTMSTTSLPGR
jgi:hypothetical protein